MTLIVNSFFKLNAINQSFTVYYICLGVTLLFVTILGDFSILKFSELTQKISLIKFFCVDFLYLTRSTSMMYILMKFLIVLFFRTVNSEKSVY